MSQGPAGANTLALTIDDGYCVNCVADYVAFAETTGTAITFSPNGTYRSIWDPHAVTLRGLVAAGQVQIGNHTWTHKSILGRSAADVEADINQNEQWIQESFGITARPWFRPPYGYRNSSTDQIAANIGYTRILMWNGTFGDATPISATDLLALANMWMKPGTIMLGHANHPTITGLFPQVLQILSERNILPVTLDQMFGTTRAIG